MAPLFFIILALLTGTLIRHLLKKSPIPYTVLLLVAGLLFGFLARMNILPHAFEEITSAIHWAGHIDPHVVLFVFLPTLIFEAAFGMDWHTFRKTAVNASLLAIPGIVIALGLTAIFLMGIKSTGLNLEDWTWPLALMFGSVVSATDPVAVVAILKELGASKKLSTLIDGESLLNDGTAIVFFMVFYLPLAGQTSDINPFFDFLRVSLGGVAIGLSIAFIVMFWLRRVFNDALVEITVILAAAYLAFFLAEEIFHVSGVLALFGLGITMASTGKTRISPEVEKFLHEFWELAVYIANTLIFIIVGVIIASRVTFTITDLIILLLLYAGIHLVRALMIAMLYPFMKRSGYGLNKKEAVILWYGALRGAVALALALIVSSTESLPAVMRDQFLFYTAGLVVLTLLINATTAKLVIDRLKLTTLSPSKAMLINETYKLLKEEMKQMVEKIRNDRYFKNVNPEALTEFLPSYHEVKCEETYQQDKMAELRRLVLEKEKASYWEQFEKGLIGPDTVIKLSESISEILDQEGKMPLSERTDLENLLRNPAFLKKIQNTPWLMSIYQHINKNKLMQSYDFGRAFVEAQTHSLNLLEELSKTLAEHEKEIIKKLEEEISQNLIHGQTFLRNFKKFYPAIYVEFTTRQAIRTMLNHELQKVDELVETGQIELSEAQKMKEDIEERMKRVRQSNKKFAEGVSS